MFVLTCSCLIFNSRILVVFEPDDLLLFTGGIHAVLLVILKPFEGGIIQLNSSFFFYQPKEKGKDIIQRDRQHICQWKKGICQI